MEHPKPVENFLIKNGFKKVYKNEFENDVCCVRFRTFCYECVIKKDGHEFYTDNYCIYTLIGWLTYYELMDKNYVK